MPDGRRLAYTEWGLSDGTPILCFHGSPGARTWCPDEAATAASGVRLIMPDRPGIGRSDPLEGRTLADWPKDVLSLADALEIPEFGIIGISAGGQYAAACAALISGRLRGVAIVACRLISEYNWAERPGIEEEWDVEERAEFDLVRVDRGAGADLAAQHNVEFVDEVSRHPEGIQEWLESETEADNWFFDDPSRRANFEACMREWGRQGVEALKWDLIDVFLPWGFRLSEISIPVTIWCGREDPRLPHMDFQVEAIPHSSLTIWPGCGHLGFVKHWSEILESVNAQV
jgi:pimeloyl-ACP methyl ester carboxylesterase